MPSALMEGHLCGKERNALYTKAIKRVLIHVVSIVMHVVKWHTDSSVQSLVLRGPLSFLYRVAFSCTACCVLSKGFQTGPDS